MPLSELPVQLEDIERAARLLDGAAPAGAYTPAAAFGPGLAVAAGGLFLGDAG